MDDCHLLLLCFVLSFYSVYLCHDLSLYDYNSAAVQ